ncbi:MAG: glucosyl transferase [Calditrichaeota bacterium]|nr:glucosyl transferase [Calditrichota bacterium]
MKYFFLFVFCLLSFVLLLTCQKLTEPLYNTAKRQLEVLDVSCTEVWLSLKTGKDFYNQTLKLYRDDSLIIEKTLTTTDSILLIENLQPATQYAFKAKVYDGSKLSAKSATVTATTMDTTSHEFEWQTFEFGGQGGSSSFYDVAIIDENDIWAVGEIYTADDKYNAAHWNGEKWELRKVPYIDEKGYAWITPIYSVFAFSKKDIWFEGGIHWNGSKFISIKKNISFPSHVNKIWGSSSSDLYIVGNNGLIAHYDGQQWQRIESGTTAHFKDIYGKNNFIVCSATNYDYGGKKQVFQILENRAIKSLNWSFNDRKPYSIWFKNKYSIYACGDGIFRKISNQNWQIFNDDNTFFMRHIRGNDHNDIFVVDDFGQIFHFNGLTWKFVFNKDFPNASFDALSVKDNLIIAIGYLGRKAYLVLLRR